jgi:bifunctional UDP-N-acetylglucosamine pyrophosphorylase/glucosamine-1-phosphate N-acetyltransferase
MNVIVLAAGKGSRMKSGLPKVLHPIGGQPMAGHVIRAAQASGARHLVVVVGHGAEQVLGALARFETTDCSMAFAVQDPPLGTGHAVAAALPSLAQQELCLVLYGDVPLLRPETLSRLIAVAQTHAGMAILSAVVPDPTGYGRIVRGPDGGVLKSVEHKDADAQTREIHEVNSGILIAPTEHLCRWVGQLTNHNAQGEYYLTDVLAMAVAEGRSIGSLVCTDCTEIEGINSQAQRASLERVYQRRQAEQLLDQGVRLSDPARFDLRGSLSCGQDVFIDVGCVFEGSVTLGTGVEIGPHCVLKNVVVAPHARIHAMSVLEDCQVGESAIVGPFARIRPGTVLAEHSHIGNFTEVKNSHIGPHSKANHLSYIGDASVGAHVNIGAGTITCNYDGAAKHKTVIEDNAFIGSDTQLVAPVTVGEGATVGAGTTVTQNVPSQALALSRVRQAHIAHYQRPKKPGDQ